jgi:hypothetical protein
MSTIHEDITKDVDTEAPGPPISVPDSGDAGEGGKLKMIVALVKKSLGVKDIAAMFVTLFCSGSVLGTPNVFFNKKAAFVASVFAGAYTQS